MAEFIHSILRTNNTPAADGDVVLDLPVNPLTLILIHLNPLSETSTVANYALLEALLSSLDTVRVSHKGASVLDISGVDLAVLAMLWHGFQIWQSNAVAADNERRSLVLPVCFGRRPYTPNECFPETKKGELQLTLTFDIADTGFDNLNYSVETVELPGAVPETVQKVTTLAQTLAATGQNDVDLPIGNVIRAILCFGTTGYTGATPTPTLGQLSVYKDNRQMGYTATDFEVVRSLLGVMGRPFPPESRHVHDPNFDVVAADSTDLATVITLANEIKADLNALTAVLQPQVGASIDDNYALLNFDPTGDDLYSLETQGAGRVNVRLDAEAANAVRVLPIERVAATQFTR